MTDHSKPRILVTGATGRTGGQVAAQLLAAGYPVRAYVRREDRRSAKLRAAGAEIAVGDLTDPQALTGAMHGVQRAFFLPPFEPYMIQCACTFAVAARETRLESMVGLSQWLASPAHPALTTRQHWLADRLFAMLPDTTVTIVNPGFFADLPYMILLKYAAHLGLLPFPASGSSRNAPPSVDDIARVAVGALVDPSRHAGRTYRPTGPEMLSVTQMARIMGAVLGRTVRHVRLPMWMFYKAARMDGIDPFLLSQLASYMQDHDRGAFEIGGTTDDVLQVAGRAPESFETITGRYAAHPQVQSTPGAFLKTLAAFMSVPLRPGMNPRRYAEALRLPRPDRPILSADSALWRGEHGATVSESVAQATGLTAARFIS
jgi:NAD(P)H dehydrogenase (quinone)